jgi:hypothetical protein
MNLRRASFIAALLLLAAVGTAAAQFQPAMPQQQPPPCVKEFMKLRDVAASKAKAIRDASARKASPQEACHLFTALVSAEAKMVKYAADNTVWCGIPDQAVAQMKKEHVKATEMRSKICRIAAAPQAPRAPTLSDALGSTVPDASNIKPGRGGTFDTLTGAPLGSR